MIQSDMLPNDHPQEQTIQIVLFGSQSLLLDSLGYRLDNEPDFKVLLAAADWQRGIRVCVESASEIALIDLDLTESDPFEIASEITADQKSTRLIFLAQQFTDASIKQALEVHASGLLLTRSSIAELIAAIRRVSRGHFCFSAEIEQRLAYNADNHSYSVSPRTGLSSLTDRQKEVLRYLALGMSVKEVAGRMYLSNKSIDSHKYRIMNKLGINDRVKLARYAIREGLVEA